MLLERLRRRKLKVQARVDLIGIASVHDDDSGTLWRAYTGPEPADIRVRLAVAGAEQDDVDQAAREVLALLCCGPAGCGRRALAHHAAHPHPVLPGAARERDAARERETGWRMALMADLDDIVTVPLHAVAHGRAGDKGNRLNVSVIPYEPEAYALLAAQLTPERVLALFAHRRAAKVTRYDLPLLHGVQFRHRRRARRRRERQPQPRRPRQDQLVSPAQPARGNAAPPGARAAAQEQRPSGAVTAPGFRLTA